MKRFSLSYHHKERRQEEKLAGRRSCDVDSRRRRSFDRSVSIKRQGLLEVDELKATATQMPRRKRDVVKNPKLRGVSRTDQPSSCGKGELLDYLTSWDALRAALPVGTVSGAPKVKAMELIDELEVTRRGPYSGGFGGISFNGDMDIALALRTMVFPTNTRYDTLYSYRHPQRRREWIAHIQAGAIVVADSNPDDEQRECENKAAALARAIDLAESSFLEIPEVTTPRINNILE